MVIETWKVYWSEHSSDTYLHGAKIQFHSADDVEYENYLMPSGTIIKQWYSKTSFQTQKIEPILPMIDGESQYHISVDISSEDEANCLIRLVFFDRYEHEVGFINVREKEMDFQCPLKTYSYRMQLIHAGASHFHFHSVTIQEVGHGTDKQSTEIKKNIKKGQKL